MDGIVDFASAAAGIAADPAATPPPLFPSDEKLVRDERYRDLHPNILRVVSMVGAHLHRDAQKWGQCIAILWGDAPTTLRGRYSLWEPKYRSRRFRMRFIAVLNHMCSFNSAEPNEFEVLAKKMKADMDAQAATAKARAAEKKRKQDARHGSSLGTPLPDPNQAVIAPFVPGTSVQEREKNQAKANFLPANPGSLNLLGAPRFISIDEQDENSGIVDADDDEVISFGGGGGGGDDVLVDDREEEGGGWLNPPVGVKNAVILPPPNLQKNLKDGGVRNGAGNGGGAAGPIPLQNLFGIDVDNGGGGRGHSGRGQGRDDDGGGRGRARGDGPLNNNQDDAAAAAGNQPHVYIQDQVAQVMQHRNIDISNLRDLLYNNLCARAHAAFQYIPVPPPPPALPALPALPAPPAPAPVPVATASLPSRIMELVALKATFEKDPDLAHLAAGVIEQINALLHRMVNNTE